MVFTAFAGRGFKRKAIPQEGAEDDIVFEPLGFVNGHDLHQILVRLQAQLGHFDARLLASLGGQPAHQGVGRRMLNACLLKEFDQV